MDPPPPPPSSSSSSSGGPPRKLLTKKLKFQLKRARNQGNQGNVRCLLCFDYLNPPRSQIPDPSSKRSPHRSEVSEDGGGQGVRGSLRSERKRILR